MNKLYTIRNDDYKFQELDLEIDDFIDDKPAGVDESAVFDFSIENTRMAAWWKPVSTEFVPIRGQQGTPIPDISKWINASLVLSPKAHRLLGQILTPWGELLPIDIFGETYYIFNCLTSVAANEKLSEKEYFDDEEIGIKRVAFESKLTIDKLIFKTPFQNCLDLYCTDKLKDIINSFGLTGVVFDTDSVASN